VRRTVNQMLNIERPPFESLRLWRLDQDAEAEGGCKRHGWQRWHRIDRSERENRIVVIIEGPRMTSGMMIQRAVRLEMAMNNHAPSALFSDFVHVLGRRDRDQPQSRTA
jgi:hypothetical protein